MSDIDREGDDGEACDIDAELVELHEVLEWEAARALEDMDGS